MYTVVFCLRLYCRHDGLSPRSEHSYTLSSGYVYLSAVTQAKEVLQTRWRISPGCFRFTAGFVKHLRVASLYPDVLVDVQSRWTYEPFDDTADDFNTRVGRVLNRGAYSSVRQLRVASLSSWPCLPHMKLPPWLQGALHKSSTYASSIAVQTPKLAGSQAILQGPQLLNMTSSKGTASTALPGSAYAWVCCQGCSC